MSEKNSPLVDILLELGAVVYVKTNIPQTLMVSLSSYLAREASWSNMA
jgi:Asp-tRNA(Asn)/Glu-tRNA(Gln) amidotransferase A subunit family amidase